MRSRNVTWLLCAAILAACARGTPAAPGGPELMDPGSVENSGVRDNGSLAFELYRLLIRSDRNLVFSPWSVALGLGVSRLGARGRTREQLDRVLGDSGGAYSRLLNQAGDSTSSARTGLQAANGMWIQRGFPVRGSFESLARQRFRVRSHTADFARTAEAAQQINEWVSTRTAGGVPSIVHPETLDALTRLVIVNAIYFESAWKYEFDPENTRMRPFQTIGGGSVETPMMTQMRELPYCDTGREAVVELPLREGDLDLLVVLPTAVHGLPVVERSLTAQRLAEWRDCLTSVKLLLTMPRLELATAVDIRSPLEDLGVRDAFGDSADFSEISAEGRLSISRIFHGAALKLDERGVVASAAMAQVMKGRSAPRIPRVVVDHPFLFLMVDRGGNSILFIGRVTNPNRA